MLVSVGAGVGARLGVPFAGLLANAAGLPLEITDFAGITLAAAASGSLGVMIGWLVSWQQGGAGKGAILASLVVVGVRLPWAIYDTVVTGAVLALVAALPLVILTAAVPGALLGWYIETDP